MQIVSYSRNPLYKKDQFSFDTGNSVYINNVRYTLGNKLGSGGQGDVFTVDGYSFVVKIYHAEEINEQLVRKIEFITSTGISDDSLICSNRETCNDLS